MGAAADLEVAPYTVTKEHKGWEEREYAAMKWVSTDAFDVMPHDGPDHKEAYKLFNYISGQNSEKMKIPMTAPVSMMIIPGEGPNCESNYTMSFYIPDNLQANPPQPPTVQSTSRRGPPSR